MLFLLTDIFAFQVSLLRDWYRFRLLYRLSISHIAIATYILPSLRHSASLQDAVLIFTLTPYFQIAVIVSALHIEAFLRVCFHVALCLSFWWWICRRLKACRYIWCRHSQHTPPNISASSRLPLIAMRFEMSIGQIVYMREPLSFHFPLFIYIY